MSERQTGSQKAIRQLLQALGPTTLVQAEGTRLSAGAEAAADLVRRYVYHPEEMPQLNTCLTTRFRGSGGPLSPFRDPFEPQTNDLGHELTPSGVFFLAYHFCPAVKLLFCQQPHFVHKSEHETRDGAFIYALSADETSPALAASRHAITALFSCRFKRPCPPQRQWHFHGNADRAYNTLHFASKAVCQMGALPPLEIPTRKSDTLPLYGGHTAFSCLKA